MLFSSQASDEHWATVHQRSTGEGAVRGLLSLLSQLEERFHEHRFQRLTEAFVVGIVGVDGREVIVIGVEETVRFEIIVGIRSRGRSEDT